MAGCQLLLPQGGMKSRARGYASVVHLDEAVGAPQGGPHLPQACNTAPGERWRGRGVVSPLRFHPSPFAMCPGNQEATSRPPKSKRCRNAPGTDPGPTAAARSAPTHPLMAAAAPLHASHPPRRAGRRGMTQRALGLPVGVAKAGGRGASLSCRRFRSAMAESRPVGSAAPTGVPAVGPGGPGGAGPGGGPAAPPAGPSTPRASGPGPQAAPQPPPAPQPTPQPGPIQAPLDDTRFLIASTNWY